MKTSFIKDLKGIIRKTLLPAKDKPSYSKLRKKSQFYPRIINLADKIEILNRERLTRLKFDREKFFEAAGLCIYAHRNQTRIVSGLPYADHPITLIEREVDILHVADEDELIAGLLHDLPEETEFGLNFIKEKFGLTVANLVDGMIKIRQFEQDRFINEENIDKFINALAKDIRILRLKMVDRGVNLEDIEHFQGETIAKNCQEALDFYVPLGILCGFMKAARHLSDIAFKKLNPQRYQQIERIINKTIENNKELLEKLKLEIKKRYTERRFEESILKEVFSKFYRKVPPEPIKILTKPRTVYEVDQIATMRGTDPQRLSDIVMMQIIVDYEQDCYNLVEIIHSLGTPLDNYWRDYIKNLKINGYQSLHTAVKIADALLRFQIRTQKMQEIAQEGVLRDAYTLTGEFSQPQLSWLKSDWLKIILEVKNRYEKIRLIKSLTKAKIAKVRVEEVSQCSTYNVILPQGLTPLEIAFITDPLIGQRLIKAYRHDVEHEINKPIEGSVDVIKLQSAEEIQQRNYFELLKNPLARLKYSEFLKKQG